MAENLNNFNILDMQFVVDNLNILGIQFALSIHSR